MGGREGIGRYKKKEGERDGKEREVGWEQISEVIEGRRGRGWLGEGRQREGG